MATWIHRRRTGDRPSRYHLLGAGDDWAIWDQWRLRHVGLFGGPDAGAEAAARFRELTGGGRRR